MSGLDRCFNVEDLRSMARARLPKDVCDYIDLGTKDLIALRNNRRRLDEIKLLNKVLVDVSKIDTTRAIFNKRSSLPFAIAPTGIAGVVWYERELALAKAAAKAGVPFTLAMGSNMPMEKIAAEAGGTLWYQLYLWRQKQLSYDLIKRVYQTGYKTLIWTVDIGLGANHEHNKRNGFNLPYKLNSRNVIDMLTHPRWMLGVMGRYMLNSGMPRHANYPPQFQGKITGAALSDKALRADQVSFDDIDRLRHMAWHLID